MRFFSFVLGRVTIQWKLEMKWILLSDGIRFWRDTMNWFNIVCATIVKTKIVSNVSAAANTVHVGIIWFQCQIGLGWETHLYLTSIWVFLLSRVLTFHRTKKCCRVTGRCLMYWKRYFHHMHTHAAFGFVRISNCIPFLVCVPLLCLKACVCTTNSKVYVSIVWWK